MVAGIYDFIVEKGTTWDQTLTVRDGGVLRDLTGYSANMQIKSSQTATSNILDLNSGDEITLGGSAGTIKITVAHTTTSTISEDVGVYDLELTDSSGVVTRLLTGSVFFVDEVTR